MAPLRIPVEQPSGSLPDALSRWCRGKYPRARLSYATALQGGPARAYDGQPQTWLDHADTGGRELFELAMRLNIWRPSE